MTMNVVRADDAARRQPRKLQEREGDIQYLAASCLINLLLQSLKSLVRLLMTHTLLHVFPRDLVEER